MPTLPEPVLKPGFSDISEGLRQLHWLQVEDLTRYKLCLLVHTGRCPPHLKDVLYIWFHLDLHGRSDLRSAKTAQ